MTCPCNKTCSDCTSESIYIGLWLIVVVSILVWAGVQYFDMMEGL